MGRRRLGLGRSTLSAFEAAAQAEGVQRLHLLTTTAEKFFAANGYMRTERTHAPTEIASSAEFTSLCPASAAYMVKSLTGGR
jgi:amino-acid N-acetyltransferase